MSEQNGDGGLDVAGKLSDILAQLVKISEGLNRMDTARESMPAVLPKFVPGRPIRAWDANGNGVTIYTKDAEEIDNQ